MLKCSSSVLLLDDMYFTQFEHFSKKKNLKVQIYESKSAQFQLLKHIHVSVKWNRPQFVSVLVPVQPITHHTHSRYAPPHHTH